MLKSNYKKPTVHPGVPLAEGKSPKTPPEPRIEGEGTNVPPPPFKLPQWGGNAKKSVLQVQSGLKLDLDNAEALPALTGRNREENKNRFINNAIRERIARIKSQLPPVKAGGLPNKPFTTAS